MLKSILKQQQTNCVEFWHITPLKSVSPQAEFLIHKKLLALRRMKARGQCKNISISFEEELCTKI